MIVLRIVDADLPEGWTHDATDWQVANDIEFNDIVVESLNDEENLTTKIFNVALDPEKEYYGRARMLLNTGWTEWGNIDIFQPEDKDDTVYNISMPSLIGTPIVSTESDIKNHDLSNFKLTTSDFAVYGNAKHQATSWFIETLDGKLIYTKLGDTENLTELQVDNVILEENTFYKIKAMHHGDNRDISQLGTLIIKTKVQDKDIDVPNNKHITKNTETGFIIYSDKTIKTIDYILAKNKENVLVSDTVESNKIILGNDVITEEGIYVLTLNITYDDDTTAKYSYKVYSNYGNPVFEATAPDFNNCLYIKPTTVLTTIDDEVSEFEKDLNNELIEDSRIRIREITENSLINTNTKAIYLPNETIGVFTIDSDNEQLIISVFDYDKLENTFSYIDTFETTIEGINNRFNEIRLIGPNKVSIKVDVNDEEKTYIFNADTYILEERDTTSDEDKFITNLQERWSVIIPDTVECPEN